MLQESNPIYELRPTLAENNCEWCTKDFLLEEEFMRHLLEEERLLLEEERLFAEEKRVRLEDQKRLKLEQECELQVKKRWDEDYRKRSYTFMNSDHMKQAMARCAPKKRNGSLGVRKDSWVQVCRKFHKKNECFGVVDRDMTEFLKTIKPWVEDLSRINNAIDHIWISEDLDLYLGKSGRLRCKFPWSVEVCVERPFWESLVCLDPTRQGWLLDDHIDLWVDYMWHVRPHNASWAMVSSYFVQLLLQNSMPLLYVNGEMYPIAWTEADKAKFLASTVSGLMAYFVTILTPDSARSCVMQCTLPTQGMRSIISTVSISPEGFLPSILLLVVIIVTVVIVVVTVILVVVVVAIIGVVIVVTIIGVVVVVMIIRVVVVVVSSIIKLSFLIIGSLLSIMLCYLIH
ncbi:hypothetical protein Tco_1018012 [Tanacetum coccineum]|uniref:C2H2-type domain-containing protein n=1 Tax=Tanacetum coccineum TaxID=301880 RepID=A0ABQ5FVQ1_9ASTR